MSPTEASRIKWPSLKSHAQDTDDPGLAARCRETQSLASASSGHVFSARGTPCPSDAICMSLSKIERAQGRPGARRPHGPPATKKAGGSHHRFGRTTRPSLRDRFTAYTRSPWCAGACWPPSSARSASFVANLIPASGYQDITTSPSAKDTSRPLAPPRPSLPALHVS